MEKLTKLLHKIHTPLWLTILLAIILLLRIPSLFEPYYYGDEMIYLSLGQGIRQGLHLYSQIFDNKPPLIYLVAAVAGNLFWFKAILSFWLLVTTVLFWHLSQRLFPGKDKLQKTAVIAFAALTTLPLLEGNIVNAELLMVGPTIIAFLLLFSYKDNLKMIFVAGLLFSLATLFKVPAAFDLPVIIIFWFLSLKFNKEEILGFLKKSGVLALGFIIPIGLSFIWTYFQGSFKEYVTAAFLQNLGYLSSMRLGTMAAKGSFFSRNLPLIIRALIVVLGLVILYFKKAKLSKTFLFLCIWLLCGLFAVTLSERPYPHYLIQIVPEMSFLVAILLTEKSLEQSLVIIPLTLTFFVPFYYRYYYYSTFPYYLRFLKFTVGQTTKDQYFRQFSFDTTRNYALADFLVKSDGDKKVYVTGDSPTVYALAKKLPPIRFVADYHIGDYSTREAEVGNLTSAKPHYIVVLSSKSNYKELKTLLKSSYFHLLDIEEAEIWVRTKENSK